MTVRCAARCSLRLAACFGKTLGISQAQPRGLCLCAPAALPGNPQGAARGLSLRGDGSPRKPPRLGRGHSEAGEGTRRALTAHDRLLRGALLPPAQRSLGGKAPLHWEVCLPLLRHAIPASSVDRPFASCLAPLPYPHPTLQSPRLSLPYLDHLSPSEAFPQLPLEAFQLLG
eukprot:CAMPEP_0177605628 /NCGR_PEP_ID=MMETSP0419_2-20121207/16811_1 /TAXON_ID=582737 /ORGANISM="Tetraselmis sp., Strain GSL018" /LENGTH=171 /DNA_ID=CAMNT_0019099807 /DNA_START=46 /DNA_END=561 /DNA_ORIENTATION=-